MGNLLSRKELLTKEKVEIVKVDLGNDDFVYVKEMSGREKDNWEKTVLKKQTDSKGIVTFETVTEDFRAKLCVCTVCDEEGKLIFTPTDFSLLSINMSARKLEKIVNAAQKLNAITEEDKEEIIKNSVVGQADNSNSGSVENSK